MRKNVSRAIKQTEKVVIVSKAYKIYLCKAMLPFPALQNCNQLTLFSCSSAQELNSVRLTRKIAFKAFQIQSDANRLFRDT